MKLQQLRELGAAVEKLTGGVINYGGCCVYAAAVAKRLEAMGYTVECVTRVSQWDDEASVDRARTNLRNNGLDPSNATARDWFDAGVSTYHVGVRFKHVGRWYTHDTASLRRGRDICGDTMKFECTPDGLTPDEAHAMADDAKGWNVTFDRGQIPAIRALVQEYLQ